MMVVRGVNSSQQRAKGLRQVSRSGSAQRKNQDRRNSSYCCKGRCSTGTGQVLSISQSRNKTEHDIQWFCAMGT